MSGLATIRMAVTEDAPALAAIYGPFCAETAVSFELEPPTADEMAQRIGAVTGRLPWLVLEAGGSVAGYAYASRHQERAAYRWAVNTAVYIAEGHRRRGAGRALYRVLFDVLRAQGYFKACAGITIPNPASVALHQAMGFMPVGIYRDIGFKNGAWHDVAWYEAAIQPVRADPPEPRAVADLLASDAMQQSAARALAHYHEP